MTTERRRVARNRTPDVQCGPGEMLEEAGARIEPTSRTESASTASSLRPTAVWRIFSGINTSPSYLAAVALTAAAAFSANTRERASLVRGMRVGEAADIVVRLT